MLQFNISHTERIIGIFLLFLFPAGVAVGQSQYSVYPDGGSWLKAVADAGITPPVGTQTFEGIAPALYPFLNDVGGVSYSSQPDSRVSVAQLVGGGHVVRPLNTAEIFSSFGLRAVAFDFLIESPFYPGSPEDQACGTPTEATVLVRGGNNFSISHVHTGFVGIIAPPGVQMSQIEVSAGGPCPGVEIVLLDNVSYPGGPDSSPTNPNPPRPCPDGVPAGTFCFTPPTAIGPAWYDPPVTNAFDFSSQDAKFTSINDFPSGFAAPFIVSTGGAVLGSFMPGQSVIFPNGGVHEFRISGILPSVDGGNPYAFPINLSLDKVGVVFTMTPTSGSTPTPALGNYSGTSIDLSGNVTVTPDAAPTNATSVSVSTSTNFKGKLEGDPSTGAVHVTDAHPAGTYAVTVKAFDGNNGPTTTKTFTLTVTTPPTCNPVSFDAATLQVGDRVGAVLVGDFNGDSKQDLAVTAVAANFSSRTLILLGDGAGHFNFTSEVPIGARAVAEFNGDGTQDLVALASSNAVVYLGDGTGHFSAGTSVDTGCGAPFQLAVGDFNGDGRLDLATACYFANSVTVLLGDGAGNFGTPASFSVSNGPQGLAVGDFNGDGKQDLAVACQPAGVVSILIGDGAGSFGTATNFNAGSTPRDIELGDFNGDGKQDLAVSNPSTNAASVMLGNGSGGFGPPVSFAVGSDPETVIAVGDFNGDAKPDLAVPNFGSSNLSILLGDGSGGFGSATNFGVGLSPFGVVVGDFNGDGKQDLASANWDSNDVTILLRDCTNTPAGSNIIVDPVDSTTGNPGPVTLNFSQVNVGGTTTLTSSSNNPGPPVPTTFKVGSPSIYYDISTTAQFTPPVTVCVQYPDTAYQVNEANLKLLHFDGTAWVDITTSINVQTNTVCGVTNSLSPFLVAEEDVAPPGFTAPSNINTTATSSSGAAVSYNTPIASDDFDGIVPVNCSPPSGSTFALATTHVTCSATDSAGNTTQKSFDVTVTYAWSGVLQPINSDGSSIFKLGSTIPVKFALMGASAAVTNAVARLYYAKLSNNVAGTDLEATSTASASTGNLFRYDATTGQYIFNWGTKGLTTGTYQLKVDLGDGVVHIVLVSLK